MTLTYCPAGVEAEEQDEPADGAPVAQLDGDRDHPDDLLHRHQHHLPHGGGQEAQGYVRPPKNINKITKRS